MFNFRSPTIDDKKDIDIVFKNTKYLGADYVFGSLFIWNNTYNSKICMYKNFFLRFYDGKHEKTYGFPVGEGNLSEIINELINDAKERNIEFKMFGLTKPMIQKLKNIFPYKFEFELRKDMADYIYASEDLCFLNGKKFHSKRNHISKFKKLYNWSYHNISENNLNLCEDFANYWFKQQLNKNLDGEKLALVNTFKNYKKLNFLGGYISVDNKIVALTIGEEINNNIFDIHFEKANTDYIGSYATINKEFAFRNLQQYKYINREEDMGLEGLRKSKLSYNPVFLLDRYVASLANI